MTTTLEALPEGLGCPDHMSQGALLRRDPGLWCATPLGYRGEIKHRLARCGA